MLRRRNESDATGGGVQDLVLAGGTVGSVETATTEWLTHQELQTWQAFLRASVLLMERLDDELLAHGISLADYEVLAHLSSEPEAELRMTSLASRTLASRSGITRRLDRLVGAGLVERRSCPGDRRGVLAALTDAGRTVLESAAPVHVEGVRRHLIAQLQGLDLGVLAASLDAVSESSARMAEPAGWR